MDARTLLETLSRHPGLPGREETVAGVFSKLLIPLVDTVKTDPLGNVLGFRGSLRKNAPRLLLDAHLDEIGLMVTGYRDGFLRFCTLGGWDPRLLPGREFLVLCESPLPGVVAVLPPHVQSGEPVVPPVADMLLDVGLTDEQARARVPVGTVCVLDASLFSLGGRQVSGRALDNRASCAMLLLALHALKDKPLPVSLVVCGSVQEEGGARGAAPAVFGTEPDACLVLDVTYGRSPDAPKDKTFPVGYGPCIGVGPGCHRGMGDRMKQVALELSIPYQLEVMEGATGTNAWPMQIARKSTATAMLSAPLKYMHSPVETLSLDDLENGARLIAAFILSLSDGEVL